MRKKYFRGALQIVFVMTIVSCNPKNTFTDKNKLSLKTHLDNTEKANVWYFKRIIGQTLYFKNNKRFKTNLYDIRYIGQLKTKHKDPFLILSGRSCDSCDANLSVYIYSPSDGPMKSEVNQAAYSYPGKVFDYANNKLIFDSRMFYGNCSTNDTSCVVWTQKQLNDNGRFEYRIFTVKVDDDTLKESVKKVDSLILTKTSDRCRELPGIDVTSEP